MTNPYEAPQISIATPTRGPRHLDRGVLVIAAILLTACMASFVGLVIPSVRDFLFPRFGSVGALISMNPLIFIGMWIKNPTYRPLLGAGFVTCMIGLINACALLATGTVDVITNVLLDRLPSAWLWSVTSYLIAGGYIALVAYRRYKVEASLVADKQ